jgi:hypothetical protein
VAAGELPVRRHGLHDHPRRRLLVRLRLEEHRPLEGHRPPPEGHRPPLVDRRLFRPGRLLPEDPPEVVVEGAG